MLGFLLGCIIMYVLSEVCKYDQWRKWTIEDFELDQEIKKKEFLLWKKGEEE